MWNCKNEKKTFILETPIKNIEVNVCSVVVLNRKNGEIKIVKNLKIIKNCFMNIIEKKYAINRKNYYVEIRDMIIKSQISYEKKRKRC